MGRPIDCPKVEAPSQELLLEYQQKDLDELMHIWDTYKDKYAKNRKREMRFIE